MSKALDNKDKLNNPQGSGLDATAAGFRIVPQNSQSTNYVTVAADSGKHVYTANFTPPASAFPDS